MPSVSEAIAFLEQQQRVQAEVFAVSQGDYVLSFLGTTSARGIAPSLSVHRLAGVEPTASAHGCLVELEGDLARAPLPGESVTVSITDWPRFSGYQLKTQALHAPGDEGALLARQGGRLVLRTSQVFTVHHSPNTLHMFETIPVEEVLALARGVKTAVAGVGTSVNISPRFIMGFEEQHGALALFHGDGESNKTWLNLQQNNAVSRAVFDLAGGTGLLFDGPCSEIVPTDSPRAFAALLENYVRVGYGLPSHVYRQVVRRIAAV